MWQAETFDAAAIERELGLAAGLGFTSVRVFLHDLAWEADRDGFLERLDAFLGAADRRGIGSLLVFFDGVWNPHPVAGPQPEPRDRVHNAGWVQSPGAAVLAGVALQARQSLLVAYIALGVLVGPHGAGLIPDPSLVRAIGEIGIIFLLYLLQSAVMIVAGVIPLYTLRLRLSDLLRVR